MRNSKAVQNRAQGLRLKILLVLTLCALWGTTPPLTAQNAEDSAAGSSHLFVSTTPLGAAVFLNDELQPTASPLLKRDLPPGTYRLRILKSGFIPIDRTVTLAPGEIRDLAVLLYRPYISMTFPQEPKIIADGQVLDGADVALTLPTGYYSLRKESGLLTVDKVFLEQGLLDTVSILLPLGLLASLSMTLADINETQNRPFILSPYTLVTYGITLGALGMNGVLGGRRDQFESEKMAILTEDARNKSALELWESAQSFQSLGQLQAALTAYQTLLAEYPESPLFPETLYTVARVHGLLGWSSLAKAGFLQVVQRFPTVNTYDKALKALAEMALREGRKSEALQHYGSLILADPEITAQDRDAGISLAEALP